jgi:hypothetical protein
MKIFVMNRALSLVLLFAIYNQLIGEYDTICRSCMTSHYQSARDSIIRAWSVLDMLRSMTIAPKDRNHFAVEIVEDMLTVLIDLTALATSCQFCTEQYRSRAEDIRYLEEILGSMAEVFSAVFMPIYNGEEKMLQSIMVQSAQKLTSIKQQLALS